MKPTIWIGTDSDGRRIQLPLSELVHGLVIGPSGCGKTRLLLHILRGLFRLILQGDRISIIFIDPHEDAHNQVLTDAYLMGLGERLVVFDPGRIVAENSWTPTLNPLRDTYGGVDVASLVVRAIQKACGDRDPDQMPRLQLHLRGAVQVLEAAGVTLLDMFDFLVDQGVRDALLQKVDDHFVLAKWRKFEELSQRHQEERIESTENRLDRLVVGSPVMRRILGAAQSSVDVGEIMSGGKILTANLGHQHLTPDQRRLLGSLIVENIYQTAMRRPPGQRNPCVVIIDEAPDFLCGDADLPRALAQTRKFGVHYILAAQMLSQLTVEDPLLKNALLTNCNVRMAFGASRVDAEELANEFFTGDIHGDEVKHELYQTKFRPVESRRVVISDARGISTGESDAVSSAQGSSTATSHSVAESQRYDQSGVLNGAGLANSMATGTSTTDLTGHSSVRQRTESTVHAETIVPFTEHHEFRELSGVQFRGVEEQRERYVARVKRQPPRHFYFQHGHHQSGVALRTEDVHLTSVPQKALDRFLERVFTRTGCMVEVKALEEEIASRRESLARPTRREPTRVSSRHPKAVPDSDGVKQVKEPTRVSDARPNMPRGRKVKSNV